MAISTLRHSTIKALIWSSVERFGQQGIRFIITMVLARLLTPNDFGVIGILMVFIVVAEAVVNSGFAQAIIQKTEVTDDDLTTAFVITILFSLLMYMLVFAAAGLIANFYSQPDLKLLIRVLSVVILCDAFVIIQRTQFERDLNFKHLSQVTVISALLSGIVGITMAFFGFGVWSLAFQMISQKIFLAIFLWIKSSWIPRGKVSYKSFIALFSYGWKLQLSAILNHLFKNIHSLIIGRFFDVNIVGYYTQAKKIKDLPMQNLSNIVGKVAFPAFSKIKGNKKRLQNAYSQSIAMLSLVSFPLMLGMLVTAERLIPAVLGNQWEKTIPFFQLLCLVGILYPLSASNMSILKVTGRTDIFLKLEMAKKVLTVTAILISIRWGVYALVISQVITSYISYILNAYYSGRLICLPIQKQLKVVAPYILNATGMAILVRLIGLYINFGLIPDLIILFFTGALTYILSCHLFKLSAWVSFLNMLETRNAR